MRAKKLFMLLASMLVGILVQAQVGIGTTNPHPSSALDITATDQGLLIPRMTTAQRTTLGATAATGLQVYDTQTASIWYWNGSAWVTLTDYNGSTSVTLTGNTFTRAALTGDVTAPANSNSTTISTGAVTNTKIANNAVTVAKLPAGATGSTFLRGDGTWQVPTNTTYTASNGIGIVANDITLGGFLTETTSITNLSEGRKMQFGGVGVDAFNVDGATFSVDLSNNRVGIGTTSPYTKLEVAGVISSGPNAGSSQLGMEFGGLLDNSSMPTQVRGVIGALDSDADVIAGSIGYQPRTGVDASHIFYTEQTERMRITYEGHSIFRSRIKISNGDGVNADNTKLYLENTALASAGGGIGNEWAISAGLNGHSNHDFGIFDVGDPSGDPAFIIEASDATSGGGVGINVGDNVTTGVALDVGGTIRIRGGSYAAGKVLTSDATGVASWVTPTDNNTTYTASNGLTLTGTNFTLGGFLNQLTRITNLNSTYRVSFEGTGVNAFSVDNSTLSVDFDNNKVGIGTTSPRGQFTVNGAAIIDNGDNASNAFLGNSPILINAYNQDNFSTSGISNFQIANGDNGSQSIIISSGGDFGSQIRNIQGWDTRSDRDYARSMCINALGGNVGIGTLTPGTTLDINGTIKIRGGAPAAGRVLTSDANGLASWVTPTDNNTTYTANNGLTLTGTNFTLGGFLTQTTSITNLSEGRKMQFGGVGVDIFNVDGATFSVDATNNRVGFGTTAPSQKIDVVGAAIIGSGPVNSNVTKLFIRNTSGKTWALSSGTNGQSEQRFGIYNWTDDPGNPKFVIDTDGDVGIGVAAPAAKLDVNGPAIIGGSAAYSNTGSYGTIRHTGFIAHSSVSGLSGAQNYNSLGTPTIISFSGPGSLDLSNGAAWYGAQIYIVNNTDDAGLPANERVTFANLHLPNGDAFGFMDGNSALTAVYVNGDWTVVNYYNP